MNWVFGYLSFFSRWQTLSMPHPCLLGPHYLSIYQFNFQTPKFGLRALLSSGVCCVLACQMSWGINIHEEQPSASNWQELVYKFSAAPLVAGWGFNSEACVLP